MVDEQKRQKKLNNKDPIKDLKNLKRSQIGYNNQTNQSDSTRRVTTTANLQSVISSNTNGDKQAVQSSIQMTTSGVHRSSNLNDVKRTKSGWYDLVEKSQYRAQEINSVEIIQKYIKQIHFRRRLKNHQFDDDYQRMKKKLIHRQHVIDEIIMTENNYVRDLTVAVNCVVKPLKEQGILAPQQIKQLFLTIDEIKGLNEKILVILMDCNKLMIEREQKTNLKQHYWKWFEELSHIIPFFKIYYQYCQGYEKSEKLRKQMRLENRAYADFLTLTRKTSVQMRGSDIEDLLIKPIQRLPKYVLLFKDLIKHTEKDHPDYLNIQNSLEQFEKINNENNQYIQEFIIFKKMAEINTMLISSHINKSILKAKRKFIMEESLNIYTKVTKQYNPVICYFLSDLIVVTERNIPLRDSFPMMKSTSIDRLKSEGCTYKICKLLYLNHSSLIRLTPTPEYTTMFKITTEDETTFIAHDDEGRDKCFKTVSSLIQDIKRIRLEKINFLNQSNYKYYVIEVQGTEENNYGTINSYTTYIIQISSKNIKQKIYLRFSEILETQQMIYKHFPNINIKPLSKINWFLNHQTKILKQRKREIEDFLQEVINMPEIQKKRIQILSMLGLPKIFFSQFKQENISFQDDHLSQQSFNLESNRSTGRDEFIIETNRSTARDINELKKEGTMKDSFIMQSMHADQLNTYEQIRSRFEDKLQDAKLSENIITADQMAVTIKVYLISGESMNITTNQSITALQFSEIVATKLQLLHFHDFKLLIYPEGGTFRVIEDDQVIAKALPAVDDNIWVSSEEVTLKSKMLGFLRQRGRHSLVFRKYLTYTDQIERAQYQVDEVRLGLITDHYFYCIKQMEYPLTFTEYAQFAVIWLYLVEGMDQQIMVTKKFPYELLEKFVPKEVYEKYTDEVWKQAIRSLFQHLDQQIQQIVILNQDQAEQESNQQINFTNRYNIAMMVLINCIQLQPLFGAHVFYVGICRKYPPMVEKDVVMTKNMWLAISHQKIELYSPSKKVRFVEEQYEWITNLKSQEASIKFEIRGSTVKLLTNQSYMINSLMRDYKDIQKQ